MIFFYPCDDFELLFHVVIRRFCMLHKFSFGILGAAHQVQQLRSPGVLVYSRYVAGVLRDHASEPLKRANLGQLYCVVQEAGLRKLELHTSQGNSVRET